MSRMYMCCVMPLSPAQLCLESSCAMPGIVPRSLETTANVWLDWKTQGRWIEKRLAVDLLKRRSGTYFASLTQDAGAGFIVIQPLTRQVQPRTRRIFASKRIVPADGQCTYVVLCTPVEPPTTISRSQEPSFSLTFRYSLRQVPERPTILSPAAIADSLGGHSPLAFKPTTIALVKSTRLIGTLAVFP